MRDVLPTAHQRWTPRSHAAAEAAWLLRVTCLLYCCHPQHLPFTEGRVSLLGGGLTCFSCSAFSSNEYALVFILITEGSVSFIRQSKAERKEMWAESFRIQLVGVCLSGNFGFFRGLCDLFHRTRKSSHRISSRFLKYTNHHIHPLRPIYLSPHILS